MLNMRFKLLLVFSLALNIIHCMLLDDDVYEEIIKLKSEGKNSVLTHSYTPRDKKIWRVMKNPNIELRQMNTELNSADTELRIVSFFFILS